MENDPEMQILTARYIGWDDRRGSVYEVTSDELGVVGTYAAEDEEDAIGYAREDLL